MISPFCVYDQVSFEVAKAYALWFRDLDFWDAEYLAISFQFEPPENYSRRKPYKYYCPSYEERKCGVCGESPSELYLRNSRTTERNRERIYSEVCELVCHSHIHKYSSHPSRSACGYNYDYGRNLEPEIYGKSVEMEKVANILWKLGMEWSPTTHRFFNWEDIFTVETVLLVAKKADWPLPKEIVWMILSYVFTLPVDAKEFCSDYATSYQGFNYSYSLIDHDEEDEDPID